jgi:hypothetical protein
MFSTKSYFKKMILPEYFFSVWLVRKIHDGNGGQSSATFSSSLWQSATSGVGGE